MAESGGDHHGAGKRALSSFLSAISHRLEGHDEAHPHDHHHDHHPDHHHEPDEQREDQSAVARRPRGDPLAGMSDAQVFASIPAFLFERECPRNPAEHALLAVEDLTPEGIDVEIRRHERLVDVVNTRLCDHVVQNSAAFIEAMAQIHTLEANLLMTTVLCRSGRQSLRLAQDDLTSGGLHILSKYRQKKTHLDMIEILSAIAKLRENHSGVAEAIERNDFVTATRCALAVQRLDSKRYASLQCTRRIWQKAQISLSDLQQKLVHFTDRVLTTFSAAKYEHVLRSYLFLSLPDQLLATLRRQFHTLAYTTAANAVQQVQSEVGVPPPAGMVFDDKQAFFRHLCTSITPDHVLDVLLAVFRNLGQLLRTFAAVVKCHVDLLAKVRSATNLRIVAGDESPMSLPSSGSSQNKPASSGRPLWNNEAEKALLALVGGSTHSALLTLRLSVWQWAQAVVSFVWTESKFPPFKVKNYLPLLAATNDFIRLGECFAHGSDSGSRPPCALQALVAERSETAFNAWHTDNMDLLKVMVDNEQWTQYPLSPSFTFRDLPDMREGRAYVMSHRFWPDQQANGEREDAPAQANPANQASIADGGLLEFLERFDLYGNPWVDAEALAQATRKEDLDKQGDDDDDDDEGRGGQGKDGERPITTGASLSVVKFMGKYTLISEAIPLLSVRCFECLREVVTFYVSAVHAIFSLKTVQPLPNQGSESSRMLSVKKSMSVIGGMGINMTQRMNRHSGVPGMPASPSQIDQEKDKPSQEGGAFEFESLSAAPEGVETNLKLRPQFHVDSPNTWFGLVETAIASHSLAFVLSALRHLVVRLDRVLPSRVRGSAAKSADRAATTIAGVDGVVFSALAARLIRMENHCASILQVSWHSIREMNLDQSNKYVEDIVLDLKALKQRMHASSLPPSCHNQVWHSVVVHIMECIVDALSRVRKCSTGGRALMSLDLQMLRSGLGPVVPNKEVPHWQFVDNYIKAHYLLEDELLDWIRNHPEYKLSHLHALVNNLPINLKRQARNELLTKVTEIHNEISARSS